MVGQNLQGFVEFLGEVDRAGKFDMLRRIDVLSVPTLYREAKGLYILEALSQGVPVVQPDHGSFPELIEATGGGILFEPHSATALADALERLMDDPSHRASLGRAGRAAVRASFTDDIMAQKVWDVFERVARLHG
jgi:glycosyltransferase involved in cell wall biosynthesis